MIKTSYTMQLLVLGIGKRWTKERFSYLEYYYLCSSIIYELLLI